MKTMIQSGEEAVGTLAFSDELPWIGGMASFFHLFPVMRQDVPTGQLRIDPWPTRLQPALLGVPLV